MVVFYIDSEELKGSQNIFRHLQQSSEIFGKLSGIFGSRWDVSDVLVMTRWQFSHFWLENVGSYIYRIKTNGKIDSEAATSLIMSKLFISAYELSKNSSVFITHYIEYNLGIERQQAGNLGQAVEYAAWTPIV